MCRTSWLTMSFGSHTPMMHATPSPNHHTHSHLCVASPHRPPQRAACQQHQKSSRCRGRHQDGTDLHIQGDTPPNRGLPRSFWLFYPLAFAIGAPQPAGGAQHTAGSLLRQVAAGRAAIYVPDCTAFHRKFRFAGQKHSRLLVRQLQMQRHSIKGTLAGWSWWGSTRSMAWWRAWRCSKLDSQEHSGIPCCSRSGRVCAHAKGQHASQGVHQVLARRHTR